MENLLVSLDWLAVTVRMQRPLMEYPNHVIQEYGMTNVWGYRQVVYNEYGEKVFTLLSRPRQSILPADAGLLEIANEWLYREDVAFRIIDKFCEVTGAWVSGVSRADICCDFVPDAAQVDVIRGLSTKQFYVARNRNRSEFCSRSSEEWMPSPWRGVLIPHQQSWGHKTSDVKWKLYYKSKELHDDGGGKLMSKPYIVWNWRACGFDINSVWRLEVSIKNLNQFDIEGQKFTLKWLEINYLHAYLSLYSSRFIIRKDEKHVDKTNDKVVPFLNVGWMRDYIKKRKSQNAQIRSGRLSLLRHLVASMDEPEVLYDVPTRDDVLSTIERVVDRDGLHMYFKVMTGITFAAWKQEKRNALAEMLAKQRGMQLPANPMKEGSIGTEFRIERKRVRVDDGLSNNLEFDSQKCGEVTDSEAKKGKDARLEAWYNDIKVSFNNSKEKNGENSQNQTTLPLLG